MRELPASVAENDLIELWLDVEDLHAELERKAPTGVLARAEQRALRLPHSRAINALDEYHMAIEEALEERGVDPYTDDRFKEGR